MSEQHGQNGQQHEQAHGHGGGVPPLGLVALLIFLILCGYGAIATLGIPQNWTKLAVDAECHGASEHAADVAHPAHPGHEQAGAEQAVKPHHPPYYMVAPFALLLLSIALLPLIPATAHWWESNLHRFYVAAGLGLITLLYYALFCDFPVERHWPAHSIVSAAENGRPAVAQTIFINAIIGDFIPFIVLLFSLFTITGGIRISGNLKASPFVNSTILFIGAILASFIGTTGAAMLLIRLLLETNKERKFKVHTVVFFIFCVCNCGGCLTPLGDPPLFLGYLKGVDFFWTMNLWKEWAFVNCIAIVIYFLWDALWYYPKESKEDKNNDNNHQTGLKISGLGLNLPLLLGVVAAVALLSPTKPVLGTEKLVEGGWYPWYFLREAIQLGLCMVSLAFGSRKIREANSFNFAAIIEVAALFFGIFICMQAPLQILNVEGKNVVAQAKEKLKLEEPVLFFWATGALSSVLDNAPTYVVFFETAKSLSPNSTEELKADPHFAELHKKGQMVPVGTGFVEFHLLAAVSLGAVFMGAMTYIGNGPNFMVKAIAEQSGVKMPSFFGYMVYSFVFLLPLFIAMVFLFL